MSLEDPKFFDKEPFKGREHNLSINLVSLKREAQKEPYRPGYVFLSNVTRRYKFPLWEKSAGITEMFDTPLTAEEVLRRYSEREGIPKEDLLVVPATICSDDFAIYQKISAENRQS